MIKLGTNKEEMIEYNIRKVRLKSITLKEAVKNLNKNGIEISEEELRNEL